MNRFYVLLLSATLMAVYPSCHFPTEIETSSSDISLDAQAESPIGHGYDFFGNGKAKNAKPQKNLYTTEHLEDFDLPEIDHKLAFAIKQQLRSLKYKKRKSNQLLGDLEVSQQQLKNTANLLLDAHKNHEGIISGNSLKAHKIKGEDGRGNVHFTGYFTPILKVSHKKTKEYPYPLYAFPKEWEGELPTRKEIEGDNVLDGMGLEIAYAKNRIDIYFMQVQGSGIVEYEDGSQMLFAHNGSNKQPYRSIGKYMIQEGITTPAHVSLKFIKNYFEENPENAESILFKNESYIFFKPMKSTPKGAGLVPLTPEHSIAVDTRYIPMGSILLASVPIIDNKNKVIRHEYRLLVAQDIGGAIKGPGHVDLYTGIGDKARQNASALHHYGNLWLLLPNEEVVDSKAIAMKGTNKQM